MLWTAFMVPENGLFRAISETSKPTLMEFTGNSESLGPWMRTAARAAAGSSGTLRARWHDDQRAVVVRRPLRRDRGLGHAHVQHALGPGHDHAGLRPEAQAGVDARPAPLRRRARGGVHRRAPRGPRARLVRPFRAHGDTRAVTSDYRPDAVAWGVVAFYVL